MTARSREAVLLRETDNRRRVQVRLEARRTVRHGLALRFPWLRLPPPTWSAPGHGGHDCGRFLSCPLAPAPVIPLADDRFAAGAARARSFR